MSRVQDECLEASSAAAETGPTLVDFDEWSSLCATGHTPLILTGAFLTILKEHFSKASNIENEALRDNIFQENPEDTTEGVVDRGILIDTVYRFNPVDFGTRPAIYAKRNEMQTQRYGINDGLHVGLGVDKNGELLLDQGEYHTVGVLGSHTMFCIGRTGAEAEVLAYEVFREIQHFSPILRQRLRLKKLAVTQLTALSKLEEYDQHYVVGVVLGWAYFEAWRIKPVAPWLKTISIEPTADDR